MGLIKRLINKIFGNDWDNKKVMDLSTKKPEEFSNKNVDSDKQEQALKSENEKEKEEKEERNLIEKIDMQKNQWSQKSKRELKSVEIDLQRVFNLAIKISDVDFSIIEGFRSLERQKKLYAKGRSESGNIVTNIDGVKKKSKHQLRKAVDIRIYHPGRNLGYDIKHLSYVAGVILSCSEILYAEGEISQKVRWGGNWDKDGVILKDHNFKDLPHFELI